MLIIPFDREGVEYGPGKILFVKLDSMVAQELSVFVLKRNSSVVLFLPFQVLD